MAGAAAARRRRAQPAGARRAHLVAGAVAAVAAARVVRLQRAGDEVVGEPAGALPAPRGRRARQPALRLRRAGEGGRVQRPVGARQGAGAPRRERRVALPAAGGRDARRAAVGDAHVGGRPDPDVWRAAGRGDVPQRHLALRHGLVPVVVRVAVGDGARAAGERDAGARGVRRLPVAAVGALGRPLRRSRPRVRRQRAGAVLQRRPLVQRGQGRVGGGAAAAAAGRRRRAREALGALRVRGGRDCTSSAATPPRRRSTTCGPRRADRDLAPDRDRRRLSPAASATRSPRWAPASSSSAAASTR